MIGDSPRPILLMQRKISLDATTAKRGRTVICRSIIICYVYSNSTNMSMKNISIHKHTQQGLLSKAVIGKNGPTNAQTKKAALSIHIGTKTMANLKVYHGSWYRWRVCLSAQNKMEPRSGSPNAAGRQNRRRTTGRMEFCAVTKTQCSVTAKLAGRSPRWRLQSCRLLLQFVFGLRSVLPIQSSSRNHTAVSPKGSPGR